MTRTCPHAPRVRTVLGVDLGSTGTTAIVVVSSIPGQPQTYVRHAVTRTGLAVSQVVVWVRQLQLQWGASEVVWEGPYRVLEQAYRELGREAEADESGRLATLAVRRGVA